MRRVTVSWRWVGIVLAVGVLGDLVGRPNLYVVIGVVGVVLLVGVVWGIVRLVR